MIKKTIVSLIICLSFAFAKAQQTPIHQRAKISFTEDAEIYRLEALGIPTDHGIKKKDHYIISEFSTKELEIARTNGFQVDVLIPDVTAHFLAQNRLGLPSKTSNSCDGDLGNDYPTPANFNQGSMGGYLTYQEVLDELDDMRAQYPNLISAPSNISDFLTEGQSNDNVTPPIGGNGIKWVRISDNPDSDEDEPEVLYTSIHHAREPMSLMQNIYYMWYLLENYDNDDEIRGIVDNTELYFVPVVNPDGYLHNQFTNPGGGGFWRKNRFNGHGVDNNRNYDYFINGDSNNGAWGGSGSSGSPTSDIYRGASPISEVENRAVKWLLEQHNFVIALNSHTFGELLYYPFAYNGAATPDESLFVSISDELTSRNGYNGLRDCCFAGDSDDFMYGTVGTHESILAFTPEVGQSFWPPASAIDRTCKEMMYQNITAAKMTNNYGSLEETASLFTGDEATAEASFSLRNFGVRGSGNFTVLLSPVSSNITDAGNTVTFTGMSPLEFDNGIITYAINPDTAYGDVVSYELVVNNGLYDEVIPVTKIYGASDQVFYDDGDSATANFDANDWGTTDVTFVSPSNAITDSPSGSYGNNEDSAIVLEDEIDLTEAIGASVTFYARWAIEANFDYVQFEISTDGGTTWEAQCGEFTSTGTSNQAEGQPLYDGIQPEWIREEINLSAYLGERILARFHLVTDSGNRMDGFYFDDLEFKVLNEEALGVDDAFAKAFTLYPNPVDNVLNINTSISNYTTSVYNLQGQQISQTQSHSGNGSIDYSRFATGIYFVRMEANKKVSTFKVIKR